MTYRLLFAAPFVATAGMLLFGVLLLSLHRGYEEAHDDAARHTARLAAATSLYQTLRHAESSQRGYLLTGDPAFLEELEAGGSAAEAQLALLPGLALTRAESAAVEEFSGLARTRMRTSAEALALGQRDGTAAAAALIAEGTGRRAISSMQDQLEDARRTLTAMQEERQQALRARYRRMGWYIAGGTGFAALAGLLTGTSLTRYGRQRDRAVKWLEGANEQLRQQAEELESQAVELEESATELAARGEHFQALLEEASDMIMELDRHGMVRYCSPGTLRRLGCARDAITGRPFAELLHPEDRDTALPVLDRVRAGRQADADFEWRLAAGDGHWRQIQGCMRNLLDRPAIGSIVVNGQDVTQERSVEFQLRHAQKMEAVGQLAGGIAHDFNNLLTSIRGYASFASDAVPAGSPVRADIDEVIRSADMAASLTRQLLTFSRKQVTQPTVVDVNHIVADSLGMLRRLLGSSVEMMLRPDPSIQPVLIDDAQLRQVIMNLAVNARDAMPEGGRLFIETESGTIDEDRAQRHGVRPGPCTVLGVTDDGEGMPPEVRARIFEPFFTTKEQGRGTGLGLSTAYGIIRQAGGYIWVYSEPGNGTTFRIYLPVAAVDDVADAAPVRAAAVRRPGHEALLLVEDDEGVRSFALRALARDGYSVTAVASAEDALAALEHTPQPFALVITDVIMPGMGGAALGRELERLHPHLPVLYTSGYPRDEMSWRGSIPPNVSFIAKPYSPADLLATIGRILDGSVESG